MKVLKGRSAERLRKEFPELGQKYWGLHIWGRGYFVSTVSLDRDTIKNYVKQQVDNQIREEKINPWKVDSG